MVSRGFTIYVSKSLEIVGVVKLAWCWNCREVTKHEVNRRHLTTGLWEMEECRKCGEKMVERWSGSNTESRIPFEYFEMERG